MPGAGTTPDIWLTLTGDSADTVPSLVTVRIDSASHQRPDAPISANSGHTKHPWPGYNEYSVCASVSMPAGTIRPPREM